MRCSTPISGRTLTAFGGRLGTLSSNGPCSTPPFLRLQQGAMATVWLVPDTVVVLEKSSGQVKGAMRLKSWIAYGTLKAAEE